MASRCRKCDRICNSYGISKFIYLACTTLVTAGFIVECILIHLVVVPYTSESTFLPTICNYNSSIGQPDKMRCENKCSKERSKFICLPIKVNYIDQNNKQRTGFIYDYYRTYNQYKANHCSTSPCHTREDDNKNWVEEFNRTLKKKKRFKCSYKVNNYNEVLLYKLHPDTLVLHSVLWPTLIFVLGIIMIWVTYCCAGCSVWAQDKTVIA